MIAWVTLAFHFHLGADDARFRHRLSAAFLPSIMFCKFLLLRCQLMTSLYLISCFLWSVYLRMSAPTKRNINSRHLRVLRILSNISSGHRAPRHYRGQNVIGTIIAINKKFSVKRAPGFYSVQRRHKYIWYCLLISINSYLASTPRLIGPTLLHLIFS